MRLGGVGNLGNLRWRKYIHSLIESAKRLVAALEELEKREAARLKKDYGDSDSS